MDVDWTATDPGSGRFTGVYSETTIVEMRARLRDLRARGEGYMEVARVGAQYPYLMLGFSDRRAVLYRMNSEESMSVCHGDGSVAPGDTASVLVMDQRNEVPGSFVMELDRGLELVEQFVRNGSFGGEGDWSDL